MKEYVTEDNYLTEYALFCGYRDIAENDKKTLELTLFKWETGCPGFTVQLWDWENNQKLYCETFHSIGVAKHKFKKLCKQYKLVKRYNAPI